MAKRGFMGNGFHMAVPERLAFNMFCAIDFQLSPHREVVCHKFIET
jgi:hypothetical protein